MVFTYIVFFLLFFLPLVVLPIGISPFESSKVIIAEIAIEFLLFLYLCKHEFHTPRHSGEFGFAERDQNLSQIRSWSSQDDGKRKTYNKNPKLFSEINPTLLKITGAIFLLTLIYVPFQNSQNVFFGNIFRLQGVLLLWHLLIFALISSTIKLKIGDSGHVTSNAASLSRMAVFVSLSCLFIGSLVFGVNQSGRNIGTLGEPNALAATAVFIFPFAYFVYKMPLKIFALFLTFVIVVVSGSRSGFLALTLELIFIFFAQIIKPAKAFVVCLLLLVLSFSLPIFEGGGWFENRAEIWQTAFNAGLKSPIIGHGFGNITNTLLQTSKTINNNVQYQYVDSSHNFMLDWWVQAGLAGVALLTSLLALSIWGLLKRKRMLELTALLGIITAISFNPASVAVLFPFWWLIGQGFSKETNNLPYQGAA